MEIFSDIFSKIPKEQRREFSDVVFKENILKMIITSALIFIVEIIVALFFENFGSRTFYLACLISGTQLLFIPLLLYYYKNITIIKSALTLSLNLLYVSFLLLSGIFWSLFEQSFLASGSTYILAVFAVSTMFVLPSTALAIMLFSAYLVFMHLLPNYQMLPQVIQTLNINSFTMSVFAFMLNRIIATGRINTFISGKVIIEKNIQLEHKNKELSEITMRDSMTNLLNHKSSLIRLKEEAERSKRIGYPLSVAMIDLDNFKLINDTYGHQIGDDVIIEISKILCETCRNTDFVGRYGGEEFIVIMPDTNARDANMLFERLMKKVRERFFVNGIKVTLSCGITEMLGESVHSILKVSDFMLYEAKRKGKNRIEVNYCNESQMIE